MGLGLLAAHCARRAAVAVSGSTACSLCAAGKYSTVVGAVLDLCQQVAGGFYPSKTATITTPLSGSWVGVTASPDFRLMAATLFNDYIYMSSDSGVTWTVMTAAGSKGWRGITSSPDFTKLVTVSGYINFSVDAGTIWSA